MRKIFIVLLILVVLSLVGFLRHYFDRVKDDKSRLEWLASKYSILVSEPKGNQQVATLTLDKPAIMITRHWCRPHVDQSGYGHEGVTNIYVRLSSPRPDQDELYTLIFTILAQSADQVNSVFEHPDLRVRLLGLAAIEDYLRASSRPTRVVSPRYSSRYPAASSTDITKPRLLEALALLADDTDPFLAAGALFTLSNEKFLRPDILKKGFAHSCTEVRYAAALYAGRGQEALDAAEMRELIGVLIDNIDDRDGAVRGNCYNALGGALFQLDWRLQGIEKERNNTFPREVAKLPQLPMGWDNIAVKSWTHAHEVKQMWQKWFDALPDCGGSSAQ
ncbi:MAG: hypothetical protein ACYTBJ_15925 [Planctomycetota bacterium]|jgi:hypothetical protein